MNHNHGIASGPGGGVVTSEIY